MYIAKIAYTKTFLQIEKPNQDGMQDNNLFYKKKPQEKGVKLAAFNHGATTHRLVRKSGERT